MFSENQLLKGVKLFSDIVSPLVNLRPAVTDIDIDDNLARLVDESDKDDEDPEICVPSVFEECDVRLITETGFELMTNIPGTIIRMNVGDGVETLMLPHGYSQGTLSRRNGSNACTVIALLAGYSVLKSKDDETFNQNNMAYMLPILTGSMEIGNVIHDSNDPSLFCTVDEAIQILPGNMNLDIIEETNCSVTAESPDTNSLEQVIADWICSGSDQMGFIIIIQGGKSYCFVSTNRHVALLDSHATPPYGARVVFATSEQYRFLIDVFFSNQSQQLIYCAFVHVNPSTPSDSSIMFNI